MTEKYSTMVISLKAIFWIFVQEEIIFTDRALGPVVQSVVSLTSSLRVILLTVLADSIYNILIFFAEKNVSSFCYSHFFQQKIAAYLQNFNESLTNDVVSFGQLGPDN